MIAADTLLAGTVIECRTCLLVTRDHISQSQFGHISDSQKMILSLDRKKSERVQYASELNTKS